MNLFFRLFHHANSALASSDRTAEESQLLVFFQSVFLHLVRESVFSLAQTVAIEMKFVFPRND
jgi:hypothetical protein